MGNRFFRSAGDVTRPLERWRRPSLVHWKQADRFFLGLSENGAQVNESSAESPVHEFPQQATVSGSEFECALAEASELRRAANERSQEWAQLSVRLGDLYLRRRLGQEEENLKHGIQCYDDALTVYERQAYPREWIICHRELGRAYFRLSDGQNRNLKKISFLHYQMAMALTPKDGWPELWHTLHLDLALLFLKHSQSAHDEDAKLSDEHYKIAFELDERVPPELYDVMRKSYELQSRLFELQSELAHARSGGTTQ
jgi:tetratricopeptide (TPR) repeat protein